MRADRLGSARVPDTLASMRARPETSDTVSGASDSNSEALTSPLTCKARLVGTKLAPRPARPLRRRVAPPTDTARSLSSTASDCRCTTPDGTAIGE